MKVLITTAFALTLAFSPATAEEPVTRTVVIMLDPANGTASEVIFNTTTSTASEVVDLLLQRLVYAERRAEQADSTPEAQALDQRRLRLLDGQVRELRTQVARLQELLGESRMREAHLRIEIEQLTLERETGNTEE